MFESGNGMEVFTKINKKLKEEEEQQAVSLRQKTAVLLIVACDPCKFDQHCRRREVEDVAISQRIHSSALQGSPLCGEWIKLRCCCSQEEEHTGSKLGARGQLTSGSTSWRATLNGQHFVGREAFETCLGPVLPGCSCVLSHHLPDHIQSSSAKNSSRSTLLSSPLSPYPPLSNCWLQAPGSLPSSSQPIDSTGLKGERGALVQLAPATICCAIFSSSK